MLWTAALCISPFLMLSGSLVFYRAASHPMWRHHMVKGALLFGIGSFIFSQAPF